MNDNSKVHDLLETDHAELDGLLEATFASIGSGNIQETFNCLDLFWARLAMHIRAEHVRLFPKVIEIAANRANEGEILEMLESLHCDHDFFMRELATSIKAMRLVFHFGNEAETFVVVRERLEAVKERLTNHNQIEEEHIYTLADAEGVEPGESTALLAGVRKELENLPPRFRSLAKHL